MSAETKIVSTPWNEVSDDKHSYATAELAGGDRSHERQVQSGEGQVLKLEGVYDTTTSRGERQ